MSLATPRQASAPIAPAAPGKILLVEDKEGLRDALRRILEREGYSVKACPDGERAAVLLREERFLLVLTDLKLPGSDGLEVLRCVRRCDPTTPVILMTAYGTIQDAVSAMKEGAYDFLEKPVDQDHLLALLDRALQHRLLARENSFLRERFAEELGFPTILGNSSTLHKSLEELRKVSATEATVLLSGESGTGKELFARALHHWSPRRTGPFFAINCAAIPESLLENELFGHEKGAYTGAGSAKRGKMEMADTGTLFLDEIGDLSPALQGKVLRVLEERRFERVGGVETRSVDLRLVAATNRDLKGLVSEGGFRQDLFFRISVFPVHIPPLRDRVEDISLLARHFVERFAVEQKRRAPGIGAEALRLMQGYSWPGNVRELENALERAVILCEAEEIHPQHLSLSGPSPVETENQVRQLVGLHGSLSEVVSRAAGLAEREKIREALRLTSGNKSRAAELLQVSYKTLLAKLKDLRLDSEQG
ncbi:MAG TPA: sigma-54 dependent transcriptional regulator [Candidatus Polarisedimenticolia bacterium]|nr:sigma-54 dependent transcriptional regulator [Candidatus Polarisedimenticolia bacterium]